MVTLAEIAGRDSPRTTFFELFSDISLTQLSFGKDGETCPGTDG